MDLVSDRVGKIIALIDDKGSWERRVDGLRHLRALLKEDVSSHGSDVATQICQRIRLPLKAQLEDLRSQIAKEACGCVVALCHCTLTDPAVWEQCSDWFLTPLFNGSCVTVAVISKSCVEALSEIASTGRINRAALATAAQGLSHKHGVYRRVAAQFVLSSLHYASEALLIKNLSLLHRAVREGVCDPVVEVRKVSRLAFWALESLHEDSAVLLYEGLEPAVQRAIDSERTAYNAWVQTQGQRCPARAGDRLEGSVDTLHMSQRSVGAESSSSSSFRPASSVTRKVLSSTTRGGVVVASKQQHRSPSPGLSRTQPVVALPSSTFPKRKSTSAAPGHTNAHVDPHVASARANFRVASKAAATPSLPSNTHAESSWEAIQSGVVNADWSTRSVAFVELAQCVDLEMLSANDVQRLQEAIGYAARGVQDTHHKVILSAVNAYGRLLATVPQLCFPGIDAVLAAHFGNLASTKDPVRLAAVQQLGVIAGTFPGDALYKPILKVVDTMVTGKARLGGVEYLLYVVQNGRRLFSSALVLTPLLLRLFKIVKAHAADSNNATQQDARDTTQALLTTIAELYCINSDEFVGAVLAFPSVDFRHILRLMEPLLPQLAVDCKKVKEGQHIPQSGKPQALSPFDKLVKQCAPNRTAERKQGLTLEVTRTLEPLFAEVEMSPPPAVGSTNQQRHSTRLAEDDGGPSPTGTSFVRSKALNHLNVSDDEQSLRNLQRTRTTGAETGSPPRDDGGSRRHAANLLPQRAANALASLKADPLLLQHLARAKSAEEKRDAIQLGIESVQSDPRLWSGRFGELLAFPIAYTTDSQHTIRVMAFRWMASIFSAGYLRPISADHLEHVLRAVLMGLNDPYPEVQREVLVLFKLVCVDETSQAFPIEAVYEGLATVLGEISTGGDRLSTPGARALLRETGQLAKMAVDPMLSVPQRAQVLTRLVPIYIAAFGHANCDVRKAATICLVDWCMAIESEMYRFLLPFQDTQLRIVSVYLNRARSEGGRGNPIRVEDEVRAFRAQLAESPDNR